MGKRSQFLAMTTAVQCAATCLGKNARANTAPAKLFGLSVDARTDACHFKAAGCTVALDGVSMPAAHNALSCFSSAEHMEDDAMNATQIQDYARQLLEAHGAKAIAEAAQKAAACQKAGDKEHAETWRRVEAALIQMHGPRQS